MVGVTDASFAGDPDERRSQGGYLYLLGGAAVSWKSYKISTVARSTPEAEYVAASDCAAEGIFHRNFLGELGFPQMGPTPIITDSTGVQGMVISPAARCRTKYIEIHYHYVCDHVARNRFVLRRVDTSENAADDLTKPLPRAAHTKCVALMGLSVRDSTAFDRSAIIAGLE